MGSLKFLVSDFNHNVDECLNASQPFTRIFILCMLQVSSTRFFCTTVISKAAA